MSAAQATILFLAGVLGGALNAVAGGGSFIAFPALLFMGVPAVSANATNTLALWVGVVASGGAYRNRLDASRRVIFPFMAMGVAGGLAGAFLLIKTPGETFLRVIPWLMLGATLLFAFGKHATGKIAASISNQASGKAIAGAAFFELLVSIYGGYFGGGMGIMNLALFSALGMTDIHAMNALKVTLGAVINGVATVTFVASGAIAWKQGLMMMAGSIVGGYFAARWAQRLPQAWIKNFVIVVGTGMTIYFFVRAYR